MKKIYKGIDLFCGIGGFRLAMKSNNVKCVFSSDNDKFAQQTYEANFHEIPTGDIKAVEAKDIPHFDILTAGFPCQPFSYAGEKQGFNDEVRGTLFFDVCRILEYHKPPMLFLENVKGLKSHDKGKTLQIVLDSLRKLGYFFCKAQDGVISAKIFVGKVIFYLWNDVFKDYEFGDAIFNDEDGSKLSFDKFYTSEGKNSKVVEEKVALFLKNLGLIPMEFSKEDSEIEDEDGNTPESNSRNYDKFTVNDGAECAKNKLAIECIKEYVRLNPDITAQEVYEKWTSLGSIVPHFIETKEQFDSRTDNSKRSDAVDCYGTPIYVARNGYGSNGKADTLMKLVNEKNWGITIKKIIK